MSFDPLETIPFRSRAEQLVEKQQREVENLSIEQMRTLAHELLIQQIALELQNDELRRATKELSRSQQQFLALFNLAPVGYLMLDETGIIQQANQTFCDQVALNQDQVAYRPFSDFIAPSDRSIFLDRFRSFYRHPSDKRLVLRLLNAAGFFYARLEGSLISTTWEQAKAHEVQHLLLTISDISEQVQAEEALRDINERFQLFANNIAEIFWMSDPSGQILYVSPAYDSVWGRPSAELFERPRAFLDHIHPADRNLVNGATIRAAKDRQPVELEFRILRADGRERWLWVRLFPTTTQGDQINRVVGVAADITTRKQAEEELRASLDENRLLLRELEGRVTKSLHLIAGILRLEAEQFSHPAANEALGMVNRRVQMLADLYNELYRNGNLHQVNLKTYFEHIISSLGASLGGGKRREIVLYCQKIEVEADLAAGLGLILNELVMNALKHAFNDEQPGRVQAELRREAAQLILTVQDNGRGLPADIDLATLPGVGLQLVQWLTRQLNGSFTITEHQPARFQVQIPLST